MPTPDVSIIIPTYNRAAYLPRTIHSVLNQSGISFELIIVDDGSTDKTKQAISELLCNEPRLKYSYQENQGPSSARNLGIKNSRARFITFLDSDDEWLPGKLIAQLDYFQMNPDSLICQTEEIWIRHGKRVNSMNKHKKFGGFIFEKCLPLSVVSSSCVMMKREFFDQVGLFDESLPACEDYDLWLRASSRFPIGLIEKFLVIKYGGHADQRSREFPVMDRFRIKALSKLLESRILSEHQRELTISELSKKCRIIQNGSLKRGKIEEAEYYESLMKRFSTKDPIVIPAPIGRAAVGRLVVRCRTVGPAKAGIQNCGSPTLSEKNVKFFPKSAPRIGASVKAFGDDRGLSHKTYD